MAEKKPTPFRLRVTALDQALRIVSAQTPADKIIELAQAFEKYLKGTANG
jgi:hypothetical protein